MKNKVAALAAALSVLGGVIAAVPAMADGDGSTSAEGVTITAAYVYQKSNGVDARIEIGSVTNDGTDWSEITGTFKSGEVNTFGRIEIYSEEFGVNFWVDDASLKDKSGSETTTDGKYYLNNGAMNGPKNSTPWYWGATSTWINEIGGSVPNAKVKTDNNIFRGESQSLYVYGGKEYKPGTNNYIGDIALSTEYTFKVWVKIETPETSNVYALDENFDDRTNTNGITIYDGTLTLDNDALVVSDRRYATTGAGFNISFEPGYEYTVEFDVKDETNQQFTCSMEKGGRVGTVTHSDADGSGWRHSTATIYVYDNETSEACTTPFWFQTATGSWPSDDYTIDNIKVYRVRATDQTVGPKVKFETVGDITAETKTGTGTYENDKATGFVATITNTGEEEGTFNTVNWTVQSGGDTGKTGDKTITTVTVPKGGEARIALIVSGLDDANATATVTVK